MKLLLIFYFFLYASYSFAQSDTSVMPVANCSFTIDPVAYGSIDFTGVQYGWSVLKDASLNIKHVPYGASPNTITDVIYPTLYKPNPTDPTKPIPVDEPCNSSISSIACNAVDASTLSYDVYYPTSQTNGNALPSCKFPAIVLFHAGGFSDCKSAGENGVLPFVAQEFAKRGYVAFVVEYRTGRYKAPNNLLSAQQSLAEYRAFQDARGAMRSIIKHQKVHTQGTNFLNDPYQIDLNNIFIGGNSAGSIMAIHTAFYNDVQIAQIFPTPAGFPTVAQALGPVDNNSYFGKVSDAPDLRTNIRGVLDMWGQASFPISSYPNLENFWQNNPNLPPIIGFHGKEDETLLIGKNPLYFAQPGISNPNNINYNSEANCIASGLTNPYTLDQNASSPDIIGAGSKGIYDIFHTTTINQRMELYIDCDMEHGIDPNFPGRDNFGLPSTSTVNDTYTYIVQRATTFFQVIITNKLTSLNGRDLFYECVNNRVKSYDPPNTPPVNSVFKNNPANCANANDCDGSTSNP